MKKSIISAVGAMMLVLSGSTSAFATDPAAITEPARAGAVLGVPENSDQFIWRLLTQMAAPVTLGQPRPVVFETWASDADTFTATPHWPGPNEPRKFHGSVLAATKSAHGFELDVPCSPPGNAPVAGFPIAGNPKPCVAEEVLRNRPEFDYIVNNGLNTKAGLAAAFSRNFVVNMPRSSISMKGDWVPVRTMLRWIPRLGSVENIRRLYFTTVSDSVEYALVAIHVASKQNPLWVWGTFEHEFNPGRCDTMGCYDSFGSATPVVLPNKSAPNTQYGECVKTPRLTSMMLHARLSPVWGNYCLKSSQVTFTTADGTPTVLGNSVTERLVANGAIAASSCIGCHAYASFGRDGATTARAEAMLPYNPTGTPIPAVLAGSKTFDFMWGVLLAP
ncbi:hypothetical protein LG047_01575 [Methylocystis sp. WRRC1]|uniref:hypothetical protein n=1 Tax=Methylocystis sp. WRRC1 TaxID=1732014 RepID=UPI001D1535CB|nr:hypothetical protein [Methylocystis sp. WRRC1]MCC3244019.1 hypothetical protein [Methylocystis sp. WRRC1]